MITLFHLLTFFGTITGLLTGGIIGYHQFGWLGAIIGAPMFAFAGYHLGNVPWLLVLYGEKKKFEKESTEELIEGLHGKYALCPNLVLSALRIRGVDVRRFLPYLCGLMVADDIYTRNRGWVALRSALPEYAAKIPSYHPTLNKEECSKIVENLK